MLIPILMDHLVTFSQHFALGPSPLSPLRHQQEQWAHRHVGDGGAVGTPPPPSQWQQRRQPAHHHDHHSGSSGPTTKTVTEGVAAGAEGTPPTPWQWGWCQAASEGSTKFSYQVSCNSFSHHLYCLLEIFHHCCLDSSLATGQIRLIVALHPFVLSCPKYCYFFFES